jgi:CRP/FNR family cyclic AMP-dependent transcriptional regulator
MSAQSHTAGSRIFDAGDAASEMFVVKFGRVDIMVGNRLLETVDAGGIFGEMALVDGGTRSASAIAREDCEVVAVDEKGFAFMMSETPFFGLQVLRTVVGRLRRMNEQV